MNITRRSFVFLLLTLVAAGSLSAATFIIPTDEKLIDVSKGIVRGTVIDSYVQRDSLGRIETVYRIAVEEVLKGAIADSVIEIAQPGGVLGNEFLVVPGSPRYRVGTRYVAFLDKNREGAWTTRDFTLGAFELIVDGTLGGRFARDLSDAEGWSRDGDPFVERPRDAEPFVQMIRDRVRETSSRPITATAIRPMAIDFDVRAATTQGAAAWTNDPESTVEYTVSPTPATGNTRSTADTEDRIIPDDPNNDIGGSFNGSGTLGVCFYGGFIATHTDGDGESYFTITAADVVIQDGINSSNLSLSNFNSMLTHEIGHSLGFRHSDRSGNDAAACSGTLPCSSSAIMTAVVTNNLNGALQSWDTDGVRAVYGTERGGPGYLSDFAGGKGARGACPSNCSRNTEVAWRIVGDAPPVCNTIVIGGADTACASSAGNAASVTPTSGATYTWLVTGGTLTGGQGTSSITYTAGSSGTVAISLTLGGTCSGTLMKNVSITSLPTATITGPSSVCALSTGNTASVPDGGVGTTYIWQVTNGTITAGTGTRSITFTAGSGGTTSLSVTVTRNACSASDTHSVTLNASPSSTITAPSGVIPSSTGNAASVVDGGVGTTYTWSITNGTITAGAGTRQITFSVATTTPATLNVTVSRSGCSTSSSRTIAVGAFPRGDADGDAGVGVGDIFYMINHIFTGGASPVGSGDADGNGSVGVSDIFYLINHIFAGGPAPPA